MPIEVFQIGQHEINKFVTGDCWKENCYIIRNLITKEAIVIDPGADNYKISRFLHENCGKISGILLTHAHHDHIGGAEEMSQTYLVECYLQKSDSRLLRQAPLYALRFANKEISIPRNVRLYEEMELMSLGGYHIRAIRTPGHTPGSVCYSIGECLFTGDTLLFEHVGRTDLPGGNAKEIICSINKLLSETASDTVLFPGHGRAWTVKKAKNWWKEAQGQPSEHKTFEL